MATTFIRADEFALTRLCDLVDQRDRYRRGDVESFDGDAEIRQLEDRFGLSPLARRRLQWEITPEAASGASGDGALKADFDELLARRMAYGA